MGVEKASGSFAENTRYVQMNDGMVSPVRHWHCILVPVDITDTRGLVSSMECSSSRKGTRAWICGLSEERGLLHNSEPYFCFTSSGRPGWISWSHKNTIALLKK